MEIKNLFRGIAVVIDDEINVKDANISNIIKQTENENIPVLKYDSLPKLNEVENYKNLSFVLLDWQLQQPIVADDGTLIPLTPEIMEDNSKNNIEFIKKINKVCFCPIFIFTNEEISDIEEQLKGAELYDSQNPNNILIKNKNDLKRKGSLFSSIKKWIKKTPSIYILKEWENKYNICTTKLFYDFQQISPYWPCLMWNTFEIDGDDKSAELSDMIAKNINARGNNFEFENDILAKKHKINFKDDLKLVIEGSRYLKNDILNNNYVCTGDIFYGNLNNDPNGKDSYFINIRPQCDLMRKKKVDIYCLKGCECEEKEINKKNKILTFDSGNFIEKSTETIVPFINNGKIIKFRLNEIIILKWPGNKNMRIGRLLPPYITHVQQKYAACIQRQGLPRVPDKIF